MLSCGRSVIYKLFEKAVKNQVARQDSRHRGPEETMDAKQVYSLKASTAKIDWPCYNNARCATSKESFLLRTTGGKALSRWPEETLQRHPQILSEGI